MGSARGKVHLVGAGPGDPGLLTLRGAECLGNADLILYDYLATPELLSHARPGAELVCLGRHGHGRLMSQTETCDAMVRAARAGQTVVRLKGGDPAIFARLAEEISALEAANIPYEIVPGVTAASAASSHAGVPLTDRDESSCVAFITGRECAGKPEGEALEYGALAKFPGTLVFYMGITTAPEWSKTLVEQGKAADTPVAIVRRASWPDQETIVTNLGELPALLNSKKLRPPAIVIIGNVARLQSTSNWFVSRPLFGKTILVTRPEHQADDMSNRLRLLGAEVLCQPAIEISPPADWSPVDTAIGDMHTFDWLVFSSSNGVHFFMQRLLALGHDVRRLANTKIAAIGPATVAAPAEFHLVADVQPNQYRAEALAEALAQHVRNKRVLLLRASRGREVLAETLSEAGANIEQVVVYESRDVAADDRDVALALAGGRIDYVTVTSSAIARSLAAMFGDSLSKSRLAAISPLTAEALAELGHSPAVVATEYTGEGLIQAILHAERGKA